MYKRECNAERKGKRDRTVCCRSHDSKPGREVRWEDGETTEDGEWELEDSSRPPSPFDHGEGHNDLFGPRLVPLDGARTERKVRKRSHSSSTGSSSKEPTSPSVSPVADGSGGGQDAGSSGNETAPPSVSPVADGSGGGKETDSCESDEDVFGPMPLKEWRKYQKTKMRRYILQQSFPTTTSFSGASPSTSASLDPGNEEEVCSSSENTTGSSLFPVSDDSGGGEEAGALAQNEPDFLVKKEKRKAAVMTFTTRSMAKAARPWEERTQDNQCPLE